MLINESRKYMKVVNIRFRRTKKIYPFYIENENEFKKGDHVIVETIRGDQIGNNFR